MDTSGKLALKLLDSVHNDPPRMTTQIRLAVEVALSVCEEQRLYPGPGPWLRENEEIKLPPEKKPSTGPWEQGYDAMAKKAVVTRIIEQEQAAGRLLPDTETDAPEGATRVLYRDTKSGVFQITQRRKLVWQTHSIRQIIKMDFADLVVPTPELQVELDKLEPIDPRD